MILKASLGMSTYPIASTRRTRPVDLWTLCCVADSLQYGRLPRICSSNNEHSELEMWEAGGGGGASTLVCAHGMKVLMKKDWERC